MPDFYVIQFIYPNGADEIFLEDYNSASVMFNSISLSDSGICSKMLKSYDGCPKLFSDCPSDDNSEYTNGKILRWEATEMFINKLEKFSD